MNKEQLQEYALQIMEEEKQLLQSEEFKAFLIKQKESAEKVSQMKQYLKDKMLENGIKSLVSPNGKDDWNITVSTATKYNCDDISLVDEKYITKVELDTDNIVIENNTLYELTGNVKLVKNLVDSGMEMPAGFSKTITPRISVKVGGKAI